VQRGESSPYLDAAGTFSAAAGRLGGSSRTPNDCGIDIVILMPQDVADRPDRCPWLLWSLQCRLVTQLSAILGLGFAATNTVANMFIVLRGWLARDGWRRSRNGPGRRGAIAGFGVGLGCVAGWPAFSLAGPVIWRMRR
jgi:hypothetical protein